MYMYMYTVHTLCKGRGVPDSSCVLLKNNQDDEEVNRIYELIENALSQKQRWDMHVHVFITQGDVNIR